MWLHAIETYNTQYNLDSYDSTSSGGVVAFHTPERFVLFGDPSLRVGGVEVTVTAGAENRGIVTLRGEVRDLLIGGQEFSIDDIHIVCRPTDMAFGLVTKDDTKYCKGDFRRDGDVDGTDLAILAEDFNRTDCYDTGDCEGDFLYDGHVDRDDLNVFAAEYGRDDCPCIIPGIVLQ